MSYEILQPAVFLGMWTMFMWLWMYATRIPAMKQAKIDVNKWKGGIGSDLDNLLPPDVQWKAHNYNHLLMEPTLFYGITGVLAITGYGQGIAVTMAWIYVGLRIAHSLWQSLVNTVKVRFLLFMLSTLTLMSLMVIGAIAVFEQTS